MAINYTVLADVIDITVDAPTSSDIFYVDTNAWFWLAYTRASLNSSHPTYPHYISYLNTAIVQKSTLIYSGFTFAEIAHSIEKTERAIYNTNNRCDLKPKDYRHNFPAERIQVISEIDLAWKQIQQIGIFIEARIITNYIDAVSQRMRTQLLDSYDAMLLETMDRAAQKKIITDDGDYATVAGIEMYTSNRNVISAARAQNKLVTR